jgi:cytochrome b involved in lipid metabolism
MAESKTFTYAEALEHNTKKDLYVVIHDKVYNASSFVDEHPYVPFISCSLLFKALHHIVA